MKKLTILLASALAFGVGPFTARLGVVGSSAALVLFGVLLAVAASGGAYALAIACGAMAALAGAMLMGISPAAGGAVLVALAYAERSSRVRGAAARLGHIGASIVAGGLAGVLAQAYGAASLGVHGVAIVVGAVLVALPMLLEADDALAHSLDGAALEVAEPARTSLKQGAEIRRHAHEIPLDTSAARNVHKTWAALDKLATARVRLEKSQSRNNAVNADRAEGSYREPAPAPTAAQSVVAMVDQRIADHVKALSRAYAAVDTARAAAVGLDDVALKGALTVGDSLEDASKAMVEVK